MKTTYFAENLSSLADGIIERYGDPGLTPGPHPRSPAEAHRKGVIEGIRGAADVVRNAVVKDGGDWVETP
jgi:hypothetical protein